MLRCSAVSGFAGIVFVALVTAVQAQDAAKTSEGPITAEAAKKLKSPVPYTKKSIAKGRGLFVRSCTGCHGPDGKATVDVVANATDLTSPKLYQSGGSEGEMFRSIRDGQGASMPSFKGQIQPEEDIWNLVNFIRSLWPESMRPQLEADKESDNSKSK
jgi:mono/diheme cytochrome c family protein